MENISDVKKQLVTKNNYTFDDLLNLVAVLRSPEGCPWDREQTNKSVRNCFIDETYEFIEGLDNNDDHLMCEELGDVLFQIVFHADIKAGDRTFDIKDVIDGICKKMILRHPHVFSDVTVSGSDEVLTNWENIKNDEKQRKTPFEQMDSVSKALPSLMRSQKLQKKADKTGLKPLPSVVEALQDIQNKLDELKKSPDKASVGKLLFSVCALSQKIDVEAEETLYVENDCFIECFR